MTATQPDYTIDEATGCWVAHKPCADGYRAVRVNGKTTYAHRAYYEQFKGPIPDGLVIDHLCRNRACCNPEHLEAVPQHLNSHRGAKTRLTREQVERIRAEVFAGAMTADVAGRFGISPTHVYSICTGERWQTAGGETRTAIPKRGRRRAIVTREVQNQIRAMKANGLRLDEIAAAFGLSKTYVCQIANGYLDRRSGEL